MYTPFLSQLFNGFVVLKVKGQLFFFFFGFCLLFFFQRSIFLGGLSTFETGWPFLLYVAEDGLDLLTPPAFTFCMLGLQVHQYLELIRI